jgi:hypothetical protein
MDKLQLNNAIKDHVEVLEQYLTNDNTDKKLLRDMIITLLCKFTKKEYFFLAMEHFLCENREHEPHMLKADWDIHLENYLNWNTFAEHKMYSTDVVNEVKAFYKIKN